MGTLQEFIIHGLWDERTYKLEFNDNNLIMVGENGSGKTTVLRILYYCLSRKWGRLMDEDFKKITIKINNEEKSFTKEQLGDPKEYEVDYDFLEKLPFPIFRKIKSKLSNDLRIDKILEILLQFDGAEEIIKDEINFLKECINNIPDSIKEISTWIEESLDFRIIYLPTYRRIESKPDDLNQIFFEKRFKKIAGTDFFNLNDMEVIHIGMTDVDVTINNVIKLIEQEYNRTSAQLNADCFKGILTQEFGKINGIKVEWADPEYVELIFSSISNSDFLGEEVFQIKDKLLDVLDKDNYSDYDKIVIYFYNMLAQRFETLKCKEESLEKFFYVCNQYLSNKEFLYKPREFKYEVQTIDREGKRKNISISKLSSGEKQMVALFCYLYLSKAEKMMVIIDEPELSLSVSWQERILEDVYKSSACKSLIVATQSPFVYDNSLRIYAHGIEEFLVLE